MLHFHCKISNISTEFHSKATPKVWQKLDHPLLMQIKAAGWTFYLLPTNNFTINIFIYTVELIKSQSLY